MPVSVRSSTKATVVTAQSIVIPTPSGAQEGDLLLAFVLSSAGTNTWSAATPADWTERGTQVSSVGKAAMFSRILPSGTPPTDYTFNISGGVNQQLHGVLVCVNPNSGTFQTPVASSRVQSTVSIVDTNSISVPTGDTVLFAAFGASNNRTVTTAPSGMTQQQFSDGGSSELAVYSLLAPASGSTTKQLTWSSAVTAATSHIIAYEVVVAGPTINTQPTAVTRVLTNNNTATFSVSATGTGSLTYDWELETGVASGVYANLADGNGATWTGQTASSCTATLTAKTLSGRRVRCNVTDSNGTTTTNAVALTIFDGPQLTAFGPTNGSGVTTATLTCDYTTGTGEAVEVAIVLPDGRVSVTTVVT